MTGTPETRAHRSWGPRLRREGLQVSGPEETGRYNAGLGIEYLHAAIGRARLVIAQVNPELPWTHGDTAIKPAAIDMLVPAATPPIELPVRPVCRHPPRRIFSAGVTRGSLIPQPAPIEWSAQSFNIGGYSYIIPARCPAIRERSSDACRPRQR
jgi:hypothetical protein